MQRTALRWLMAMAFGLGGPFPALAQSGTASLTYADNGTTRVHAAASSAAATGLGLVDGDEIQTAAGRAEITTFNGTVISLDRNTRVIVNAGDRVQVPQGRVSLRTGGLKPHLVETPVAGIRAQAGSVADIAITPDARDTFVRVISGTVRMEGPWGSRQVADYHTASVDAQGGAPNVAKMPAINSDEFERWALARTVMATSIALKGTEGGGGVAYAPGYNSWYYAAPSYTYYSAPYVAPHTVAPYYTPSYYTPYYYPGSYYPTYATYSASYPSPYSQLTYYQPYSYYNYRSTPHYWSSGQRTYTWRLPQPPPPAVQQRFPNTPTVPGTSRRATIPKP